MAVDIAAAFTGIKYIRDFTKWVSDMKQDAEVLSRANEAMRAAGEVQDKLQELREENLRLLEEKRQLADQLRDVEDWQKRREKYHLFKAEGGGIVLRATEPFAHYACPSCADSRREIHVLQDGGNHGGTWWCPGCRLHFAVDREKPPPSPY
jgi:hypothetical protein